MNLSECFMHEKLMNMHEKPKMF